MNDSAAASPWHFSVAPMMDWTDRHCRYFHRLLSPRARLYTEMVTSAALVRGKQLRLLEHSQQEHPLALQLGGSEPQELAQAARFGAEAGYDEINLNVGCPSDRVQSGRFGACLMREPALVGECVKAMRDAVEVPVTVKCRIGVDDQDDYAGLQHFTETMLAARARPGSRACRRRRTARSRRWTTNACTGSSASFPSSWWWSTGASPRSSRCVPTWPGWMG